MRQSKMQRNFLNYIPQKEEKEEKHCFNGKI
jgi:hypothetical protein